MLKRLGFLTIVGFATFYAFPANAFLDGWFSAKAGQEVVLSPQPTNGPISDLPQAVYPQQMKMPTSIIVCRSKQCAPAKLSQSKEFIYNTLLHMFDSNARERAQICEGHSTTHACTEEYISVPITVGVTPAYMYIDSVDITDVSISQQNTMALELILNWGISYNGQIPVCRPSKTLLYVKDVNNVIIEDNGYNCRMTTIGSSLIKTMFAIDYIDMDYGYIGGFYSIGLSGPAYGGGNGYMIIRMPKEIYSGTQDYTPASTGNINAGGFAQDLSYTTQSPSAGQYIYDAATKQFRPLPAYTQSDEINIDTRPSSGDLNLKEPLAPNVDTIIHYNHPAQMYDEIRAKDEAKAKATKLEEARQKNLDEWKKKLESEAVDFGGAKVYPIPSTNKVDPTATQPTMKNRLNQYGNKTKKYIRNQSGATKIQGVVMPASNASNAAAPANNKPNGFVPTITPNTPNAGTPISNAPNAAVVPAVSPNNMSDRVVSINAENVKNSVDGANNLKNELGNIVSGTNTATDSSWQMSSTPSAVRTPVDSVDKTNNPPAATNALQPTSPNAESRRFE